LSLSPAVRLSEGKRQRTIVAELKVAPGTVHFHVRKIGAVGLGVYIGRKALVCTLGRTGIRNDELGGIRIGHARLHDIDSARLDIPDSKTETGIRNVELSPDLAEALIAHIDQLRRAGNDVGPEAYLFQNERGGRMDRGRVGEIVREAATLASEKMRERGMPPLQHITPHSLRRTYISILLLASEFDLKWVMDQVGHADSKMTLDVYNQLQQRIKRDHGVSFDRLIRDARAQLHGPDAARAQLHDSQEPPPGGSTPDTGGVCAEVCVEPAKTPAKLRPPRRPGRGQNLAISRKNGGSQRRDSASGHKCFQSCALSTN
jgi:site-specific recombinase XerC